jgi:predicted  nucleic acid-binding Zn-ribbon protein
MLILSIMAATLILLCIFTYIQDKRINHIQSTLKCSRSIEEDLQTQIYDLKHSYIPLEVKAITSKHDLTIVELRRQAITDKIEILQKHTMALDNIKTWVTALENDIQLLKTQLNNVEKTIGS